MRLFSLFLIAALGACSATSSNDADGGVDPPDMGMTDDMSTMPRPDTSAPLDMAREDTDVDPRDLVPIPLQSTIDSVQPMTGIVLWEDSWDGTGAKDAVQLEYAYVAPSDIVVAQDSYDWSSFDAFLDRIAGRGHQALVRFYYVYPGEETVVPQYIKDRGDYQETEGTSEGEATWFPDWSNDELQRAHLAFYTEFADRYDDDPRVAFLQVGFGLWGEYHIYDGPNDIGQQFPSKAFQAEFLQHLDGELDTLEWSISIDAGDDYYSPFAAQAELLDLDFGNFDDSFMHEEHSDYNEMMWDFFGYERRFAHAPHGGELSYYTQFDQEHALDADGIYGRTYEELSAKFHITYMIGNDQPEYQTVERIRAASMANGYRFRVDAFDASDAMARVTITNVGIAPIYYDAYPTVSGVRGPDSLRGLLPGDSMTTYIAAGGDAPTLTIDCDRLVAGQRIQYEADL